MSATRADGRCAGLSLSWVRFALAAALFSAAVWAEQVCSVCGKPIRGAYLESGGKPFCSRDCLRTTLPVCAVCGRRIEGNHLIQGDRHFCSEACFERTLPTCSICKAPLRQAYTINGRTYCKAHAEGPRCDACGMPAGNGFVLDDGRMVCADCKPSLIFDAARAEALFAEVRHTLGLVLGQPLPPLPPLELVGSDALPGHPGRATPPGARELGRYLRRTETTTRKNILGMTLGETTAVHRNVLILYGLTPGRFAATAAHELTHDLIAARYPTLEGNAPAWLEEGLCQYTSVLVCRRLGYTDCATEIETSEDPVYGDGYRYLARRFGSDGWRAISRWLDERGFERLPERAPR